MLYIESIKGFAMCLYIYTELDIRLYVALGFGAPRGGFRGLKSTCSLGN